MNKKKQITCAILWIFMLHRFYLGKPITAILQFLTAGGLLIWWCIDGYKIYKCEITDSNENLLEEH